MRKSRDVYVPVRTMTLSLRTLKVSESGLKRDIFGEWVAHLIARAVSR